MLDGVETMKGLDELSSWGPLLAIYSNTHYTKSSNLGEDGTMVGDPSSPIME
jgi:hypothetical protein